MPLITSRLIEFATPWFEVVAKRMNGDASPYYSLRMPDCVSVIALTAEKQVVLVRQYRPAVERYTLELPGGHVETRRNPGAIGAPGADRGNRLPRREYGTTWRFAD